MAGRISFKESALYGCELSVVLHSINLSCFFFVIRFIFFSLLAFFSIVHFFFFFFLKALDTEAYQVGLWAGEGNHGAVKSPCTYCRRSLLNTRCVDPIA